MALLVYRALDPLKFKNWEEGLATVLKPTSSLLLVIAPYTFINILDNQ